MKVQTKWFGEIETTESKIITLEKGIIGFEEDKKFTIVYEEDSNIMWLQSLENVSLAIPVIRPEIVMPDYDPIVEDELVNTLGTDIRNAELLVLVTLTVPSDIKMMTCNLKAPLIINVDTMKGIQLIADNDDYMVRYPIYDLLKDRKEKDGELSLIHI